MKTFLVTAILATISAQAMASSHLSSGNDLNCYVQVSADLSDSGPTNELNTILIANHAIAHKGSLREKITETARLKAGDFKNENVDERGAKLKAIIDELDITVNAQFSDGVITLKLEADGQENVQQSQTDWDRGARFSMGQQTHVDLRLDTPYRTNDEVYVEATCRPGVSK
jgi:hypothetical protein